MPTYEFRCTNSHTFDQMHKISDAPQTVPCPVCGAEAARAISGGAGLVFKGSGFYLTDYGKNAHRTAGTAPAKGGEGGGESQGGGEPKGDGGSTKDASAKTGDARSADVKSGDTSGGKSGSVKDGGSGAGAVKGGSSGGGSSGSSTSGGSTSGGSTSGGSSTAA